MSGRLRLRQICIVTPQFERVISDIREIFGIEVCHRDPESLRRFGLDNAVFAIGADFLEVQTPIEQDTSAGRFIERTQGHGGYNLVVEVGDNPRRRRVHAEHMGVRVALEINRELYQGVQLHPRDCRATMIEFARPTQTGASKGGWWPAGEKWEQFVRTTDTKRILGLEVESPDPCDLAAHWSNIVELPLTNDDEDPALDFSNGSVRFLKGETECLSAIAIEVSNVSRTLARAITRGHRVEHDSFHFGGVYFRIRASD